MSRFDFEGRIWVLIAPVACHCIRVTLNDVSTLWIVHNQHQINREHKYTEMNEKRKCNSIMTPTKTLQSCLRGHDIHIATFFFLKLFQLFKTN